MKKLLLTTLAAILAIPAFAQDTQTYKWEYTSDNTTVSNANNQTNSTIILGEIEWDYSSTSAIAVAKNGSFLGVSLGNKNATSPATVTISTNKFIGKKIRAISIGLGNGGSTAATYEILIDNAIVKNGEISASTNTVGKKETASWEGEVSCASSLSFKFTTVAEKQLSFGPLTISYVADDNAKQSAELSFTENAVSIYADQISSFEAPAFNNPNDLSPISFASDNEDVATVDANGAVSLTGTSGEAKITASFEGNDEYNEGSASYTITVKPALKTVNSVADTKALASDTEFTVGYPLTVAFVNNNNVFAVDAAGDFIQVYGTNSYSVNDIIPAGWIGNYKLYNNVTPEIMPVDELPASTEQGKFEPKSVNYDDITTSMVNSVVVIKDVVFSEATADTKTNVSGKCGETEVSFFNNYKVASVDAGTYDVTIVVTIYNNAPSLYIVSYKASTESGIADIVTDDENAPVEYYNLQGVRVDNPGSGLYIRRQGKAATKILVK